MFDEPRPLGFAGVELSKHHTPETYYLKLQTFFDPQLIHFHYKNCASSVFNIPTEDTVSHLMILRSPSNIFIFPTNDKVHHMIEKMEDVSVSDKFKMEAPISIIVDGLDNFWQMVSVHWEQRPWA